MKIAVKVPLAMAIIAATSVVTLVIGLVGFFYVRALMKEVIVQDGIVMVKEVMNDIGKELYFQEHQGRDISLDSSIQDYLSEGDNEEQREIVVERFSRDLESVPTWKGITLFNIEGEALVSSGESLSLKESENSSQNLSDREDFDLAIKNKKSKFGEPYRLPDSENLAVNLFVPVISNDIAKGALGIQVDWTGIMNIVRNITSFPLNLYNQNGFNIATNQADQESGILKQDFSKDSFFYFVRLEKYQTHPIMGDKRSVRGGNNVALFTPQQETEEILNNNWVLVGEFPERGVFTSAGGNVLRLAGLIIPLVFIITLLSLLIIIRLIVRPISMLIKGVEAVVGGDFSKRVTLNTNDELSQLADHFNKMTEKLQQYYESLDQKVKEKTAKLAERNRQIISKNNELEQSKVAMLNILEDVEMEKQEIEILARDLEKFKLAVEFASDHIVITNADGIIMFANKAAEEITGYNLKEMTGKTPRLWGKQMESKFYTDLWETIKVKKQTFDGELTNLRKNGAKYSAEIHVTPVLDRNGEVIYFVGIERDVTKVREVDRAKTEFVSMASHQLRTPLTSIKWYIEMLQEGDAGRISKNQATYLNEVHEANERMIGLVNDLLHVSRIDMDTIKITPKPANIKKIVESVVKEMEPLIERKKVEVKQGYAGNVENINGDPELIRVIFQNLISNAIKYSFENGKVDIRVAKNNNGITLVVSDNGYGIPEEAKSKIFTKLFRAENAKERESEGSGLGMYIVKSIVEQSKGTVSFQSEENKGTTFTIKLPLKEIELKKKTGTKDIKQSKS